MTRLALATTLLLTTTACIPEIYVDTPIAFPSSCPMGDTVCERNLNAQTLAYIGHKDAALKLMCQDYKVEKVMVEECGKYSTLY